MMWQAVTVPPPHWTNRYAGASPRSAGRSRHPSAHDAGYMSLISSKKSQYICSLTARACSDGPAASASRTASAPSLLNNLGSATPSPASQDGLHLLDQFLDARSQVDAHVVQLAAQLLEEQKPHFVLGPAQRLVNEPPTGHARNRQDRAQGGVARVDT